METELGKIWRIASKSWKAYRKAGIVGWIGAIYDISWIVALVCRADVVEIGRTFIASDGQSCKRKKEVFNKNKLITLVFLCPETRDRATRVSGPKWVQSTEVDIVNGSFCNLRALALRLALHIIATQYWRAPIRAKQLSTVAMLLYRFL